LKRIAIAATAVVVMLVAASSAFAAVNNYSATYKFSGGKGTAAKPAPISFNQTIKVTSATAGSRTGILHKIQTTIAGVKVNASNAAANKCTAAQINAASNDSKCPKTALIAQGSIKATLGSATDFTQPGAACDPQLDVWNGGPGKLVFFFVDTPSHQCLGGQLHTGQVPPWMASYKESGNNLNVTIPIPNTVDYPLGVSGGEVGSLSYEQLNWKSQMINGKPDIMSTGCPSSKRNYTFTFNASLPGQPAETKKTTGSAACG
jgi:hypothetical protein